MHHTFTYYNLPTTKLNTFNNCGKYMRCHKQYVRYISISNLFSNVWLLPGDCPAELKHVAICV